MVDILPQILSLLLLVPIGGLVLARNWRNPTYRLFFALTIASFYQFNLVVKHGDIFGMDKLTFGMIAGGIIFYLVDVVDDFVIRTREKVFFPYQRVIVSLGSVVVLSLADYILINYFI